MSALLDGVVERMHDALPFGERRHVLQFSAMVRPVQVRQSPSSSPSARKYFMTAGTPPTWCEVFHDVLAAGLEVGDVGDPIAHRLEIIDGEIDVHRRAIAMRCSPRWWSRPTP